MWIAGSVAPSEWHLVCPGPQHWSNKLVMYIALLQQSWNVVGFKIRILLCSNLRCNIIGLLNNRIIINNRVSGVRISYSCLVLSLRGCKCTCCCQEQRHYVNMWAPVGTVTYEVEFLVKGLHLLHYYTAVMTAEISDRSVLVSYKLSYLHPLPTFLLYSLPTSFFPLLLSPLSLFSFLRLLYVKNEKNCVISAWPINSATPWSRLLKKMIVVQPVEKGPASFRHDGKSPCSQRTVPCLDHQPN